MDDYEVKTERELIAEDICDWFSIVFKSNVGVKNDFNKGILIGLVYALRSCRYLPDDSLDDLIDIVLFQLPIKKLESYNFEQTYYDRGYSPEYFQ